MIDHANRYQRYAYEHPLTRADGRSSYHFSQLSGGRRIGLSVNL